MTHWRMQLHPGRSRLSATHAHESLAAGFIGLDFRGNPGDLMRVKKAKLPERQRHYWAFAREMEIGDRVLVMAHHFPLALATVSGDYNYIRRPEPEIGVWFRHFRRVEDVRYYADWITNAAQWERITMTETISPLRDKSSASYELIEAWSDATDEVED